MAENQPTDQERATTDHDRADANHDDVTRMGVEFKGFEKALTNFNNSVDKLEIAVNKLTNTQTQLEQCVKDGRNETALLRGQTTIINQQFTEHCLENAHILGRHDLLIKIGLGFGGFGLVTWAGVNIQTMIARLSGG